MAELLVHDLMRSGIGIEARYQPFFEAKVPDVGFDGGEAAEEPGVADDGGDERLFFRCGGVEAVEVGIADGFEGGDVFADEEGGLGEDAVLEGVEAGDGLAFGGAGSGRFECVEAVGLDLFDGCHKSYPTKSVAVGLVEEVC